MNDNDEDQDDYDKGGKRGKIPPIKPSYLLKGMALSARISGYILGPLLVLGGIGYWIYKYFDTSRIVLFIAVIIAFFVSNALIFIRAKADAEKFVEKTKDPDKK